VTQVRLFLVDDQELILDAISGLVNTRSTEHGIHVVGTAQNYEQALAALECEQPDLVLLDIQMPSVNGYETAYMIKQKWPTVKVLMLSNHEDDDNIAQARASGADGYAFKSGSHQALMDAIMAVLEGGQEFVTPSILAGLNSESSNANMGLTHRQRQVLKLLVHGETAKGIARLLNISPRTAEKHRAEVLFKLNEPNAIELVKYAYKLGLPY
jgi:DNA-binding NarL/FixJ family response regulator